MKAYLVSLLRDHDEEGRDEGRDEEHHEDTHDQGDDQLAVLVASLWWCVVC